MNWKYEARRVAAAFGIDGQCRFVDTESGKRLEKDGEEWIRVVEEDGIWEFRFMYIENFTRIDGRSKDNFKVMLTIDHRGEIVNLWWGGLESRLVKPLVKLDLLTVRIEHALGATVTATERLEWALEYEARLKPAKHPTSPK